jgi:hypothetical protein
LSERCNDEHWLYGKPEATGRIGLEGHTARASSLRWKGLTTAYSAPNLLAVRRREHTTLNHVRVFIRSTVRAFADNHADARQPLFAWFDEVEGASWGGP